MSAISRSTTNNATAPVDRMGATRNRFRHLARLPDWLPLLVIWVFAFALRLFLSQTDRVVWGDEPFYLWLGRNWIAGQGYAFVGHPDVHHGPFFPWLAGMLYLVTRDLALASELLYALFGSLLVLPMHALGKELYDRRTGLATALLVAVLPALTVATLHWGTMTEPIYLVFVYLGLWAGTIALRRAWLALRLPTNASISRDPWWAYGLAGLAFGVAYLTRPEAIAYFGVIGGFILLVRAPLGDWRSGRLWLQLLLYALGFGLCFLPYAYYVRQHTGSWMVSEKVGVAYLTGIGLAHGDTAAFDRATWGLDSTGLETFFFSSESYNVSMLSLILGDPKTFAQILYLNAKRFARVFIDWTMFPYALLPLAFLGLFGRAWTRERTLKEIYLFLSATPVLGFILFYIQARYLVPFVPVFLLWTAHGLGRFSDWLTATIVELGTGTQAGMAERVYRTLSSGWQRALEIGPALLVVILLLGAYPHVSREVTQVGSFRPAHRAVGEALAKRLPRDTVLMCRYPAIAFHADAHWVPTPNASLEAVTTYARHKGVQYWAIDERELRYRPQFAQLVTGEETVTGWELFYVDDSGKERLVVYQFVE